jgi:hypothetical protein
VNGAPRSRAGDEGPRHTRGRTQQLRRQGGRPPAGPLLVGDAPRSTAARRSRGARVRRPDRRKRSQSR